MGVAVAVAPFPNAPMTHPHIKQDQRGEELQDCEKVQNGLYATKLRNNNDRVT